jgi:hypothetical protein
MEGTGVQHVASMARSERGGHPGDLGRAAAENAGEAREAAFLREELDGALHDVGADGAAAEDGEADGREVGAGVGPSRGP